MIVFVSGSLHLVWFLSGFICIVASGSIQFLRADYYSEDIGSFFIIWLRLFPLFLVIENDGAVSTEIQMSLWSGDFISLWTIWKVNFFF